MWCSNPLHYLVLVLTNHTRSLFKALVPQGIECYAYLLEMVVLFVKSFYFFLFLKCGVIITLAPPSLPQWPPQIHLQAWVMCGAATIRRRPTASTEETVTLYTVSTRCLASKFVFHSSSHPLTRSVSHLISALLVRAPPCALFPVYTPHPAPKYEPATHLITPSCLRVCFHLVAAPRET